jgi:hypothetical protein
MSCERLRLRLAKLIPMAERSRSSNFLMNDLGLLYTVQSAVIDINFRCHKNIKH